MSFVQIGFLGAFLALSIPIMIHLVFRQRPKPIDLGTLRFLRVVLQQNARRRRIQHWLLFNLRLLAVALLAILFARPYLLRETVQGERPTVAIVIDQSATMELRHEGQRLIDRAVTLAADVIRAAPDNARFEVAHFDHQVHPVALTGSRTTAAELTRDELMTAVRAPARCFGATDYGRAMEWARDVLTKAPPGSRTLHVLTDLQQSGLAWSEVDGLPDEIVTTLHDLGRAAVNNIAVTEARPDRPWIRPNQSTSIQVTVYNGGPFSIDQVPVTLELTNGSEHLTLTEQTQIDPGAFEAVRFDLPPVAAGLWQGTVTLATDDDLPADNSRPVALLAAPPYQVLLVDGHAATTPLLASTYFLEAALRLAPPGELASFSPYEPTVVSRLDPGLDLDLYDVIVLANVGDLSPGLCRQIAERVRDGAGLLVFTGDRLTAASVRTLAAESLAPGAITGVEQTRDLPLRLRHWDARHPVFQAFNDPQSGDLRRLSFSARTQFELDAETQVLADFGSAKPALVERRLGQGTILWFATAADQQWSDWTRSRLYLPFIYQLLGYQSGLTAGGKVRQTVLDREHPAEFAAFTKPGVYPAGRGSVVVGTSPREAETDRCTPEEFAARFGLRLQHRPNETNAPQVAQAGVSGELQENELWPWFAAALLVVLSLETLIGNRTAA